MADRVLQGREAFRRREWGAAFALLSAAVADAAADTAGREDAATLEDLERLAIAAYLVGYVDDSVDAWTTAHHGHLDAGWRTDAIRCAFWVAFVLLNEGDLARGSGWVDRMRRLLGEGRSAGVEQGYLAYCTALRSAFAGDLESALEGFVTAADTAERHSDAALVALARGGHGRCLIATGGVEEGLALLDEAMAAATAPQVSPVAVGDLYCTVIEGCQEAFDVGRSQLWTAELGRWCESQPDLVLYRGQCLVHRAELMLLSGGWADAGIEAQRACDRLARPRSQPALGAAHYVRAEIHRLRGEFVEAEAAYRRANRCGRQPQPGLALLRLAQGRVEEALPTMRRILDEAAGVGARARLLGPMVEIALAGGDRAAARHAADELVAIASERAAPYLFAASSMAVSSVSLAEGDPHGAIAAARSALEGWVELGAPYEGARSHEVVGMACRVLGDEDGAEVELDAARTIYRQLEAAPDVARIEGLVRPVPAPPVGGLTVREMEVLRLLATGVSNRKIAAELIISEKTVATHVSSIFTKLDVSSRSAATAFAYEHGLT